GTQASLICKNFNLAHISTGELFRNSIATGEELGLNAKKYIDKGEMVPINLTLELLKKRIHQDDCKKGFLLDGFPRTTEQFIALQDIAKIDLAIEISMDYKVLFERLTGRRVCSGCGETYHISHLVSNNCPKCNSALFIRSDDSESVIKNRLDVFQKETMPVTKLYEELGILHKVEGDGDILFVYEQIAALIKKYDNNKK
ncbi:MAG: nucleoside monophosphate kinase, partial [Clostridia bacterium]